MLNAHRPDVSSVGNHEFDRGTEELRRISGGHRRTTDDVSLPGRCDGASTPGVDGCFGEGGHAFDGAEFPYLAANVDSTATGGRCSRRTRSSPRRGGKQGRPDRRGHRDTPTIVAPDGHRRTSRSSTRPTAVNAYVPELPAKGVQAIAVLVHEGGDVGAPHAALRPQRAAT